MKRNAKWKLNNDGAALVMAILVIAFVSILTTVLLYLANMNYQMKSTDFKTKDTFYYSEIPLETIRTRLVMDVANASAEAYHNSVLNYANVDSSVRASEFQSQFYGTIINEWEARCKNGVTQWDWIHGLEAAVYNPPAEAEANISPISASDIHIIMSNGWDDETGCKTDGCIAPYHLILDNSIAGSQRLEVKEVVEEAVKKNKLRLTGIKLVFTKDNFTSVIETNYNIVPPNVDLSVDEFVDSGTEEAKRDNISFEKCVTYVGYKKQ